MRIYQPMLFVGLGGTGCKVGAELERRMREDLCGPSGTDLLKEMKGRGYLPFQLPSCLQFVYADLNQGELDRARQAVVPGWEHEAAAQRTMHLITKLVPAHLRNSAAVAQNLRLNLHDDTISWLPPKDTDPKIQLDTGAGQLPTVGRAVLFKTLHYNSSNALHGIEEALKRINQSGSDLLIASGGHTNRVNQINVFVVFSVAGGTGGGIFYDYLHLIGKILKDESNHRSFQIFPLVLMPSAFENGQGGGRNAQLNAGPALVDLFRLIDDQNAHGSPEVVGRRESDGSLDVHYPPTIGRVALGASTVPTAFLFGKSSGGLGQDDLRRSMVALMLALIEAGPTDEERGPAANTTPYMDTFVNGSVARNDPADTGIGRRGVSTGAVATLSIPISEIVDIISSHFLAVAIQQLREEPLTEDNSDCIDKFSADARLDRLSQHAPTPIHQELSGLKGPDAIIKELDQRADEMERHMNTLPRELAGLITELARHTFNPGSAAEKQLLEIDLFRLERVVHGNSTSLAVEPSKGGFNGVLHRYARPPQLPSGYDANRPPRRQELYESIRRVAKVTSFHENVKKARDEQDDWYDRRAEQEYHRAWGHNSQFWERTWADFEVKLNNLIESFRKFAEENKHDRLKNRSAHLYQHRVGVTYLLPPHERGLGAFYGDVRDSLAQRYRDQLKSTQPREEDILNAILHKEGGWAAAYEAGKKNPAGALAHVREAVQGAVSDRLRPKESEEKALVPHMSDLLAQAAKASEPDPDLKELIEEFNRKLAGLVPGASLPPGDGKLRILVIYPAEERDEDLERFLESRVQPPRGTGSTLEFRNIDGDSMVIVFLRSEMGITDVPEVRSVIDLWLEATHHEQRGDCLSWRCRLGQHSDYLLMSTDDREQVLQRLLCVAWNGLLKVSGDSNNPQEVSVQLASDGSAMNLELTPLGKLSSWATLIQSYERWVLGSDEPIRRALAKKLMETEPINLRTNPQPPAKLYETIIGLKDRQLAGIEQAKNNPQLQKDAQLRVFDDFWRNLLHAALNRPIGGSHKTLSDLIEAVRTIQQGP